MSDDDEGAERDEASLAQVFHNPGKKVNALLILATLFYLLVFILPFDLGMWSHSGADIMANAGQRASLLIEAFKNNPEIALNETYSKRPEHAMTDLLILLVHPMNLMILLSPLAIYSRNGIVKVVGLLIMGAICIFGATLYVLWELFSQYEVFMISPWFWWATTALVTSGILMSLLRLIHEHRRLMNMELISEAPC